MRVASDVNNLSGVRQQKKYVPNIVELGALFESNYRRLIKLLALSKDDDKLRIELFNGDHFIGRVSIKSVERSKYTDTILLEQVSAAGKWLNNPNLTVRLYHDAAVAEVISKNNKPLTGVHSYPNDKMHHPDEKRQLNAFLAEWLSFCLLYGCCEVHPFVPKKV